MNRAKTSDEHPQPTQTDRARVKTRRVLMMLDGLEDSAGQLQEDERYVIEKLHYEREEP